MNTNESQSNWVGRAEWVAQQLRERLVRGVYPPSTYLPGERQLAEEFNVGRRSIRTALEQLQNESLVLREHGRGTQVRTARDIRKRNLIGIVYAARHLEISLLIEGVQGRLIELGYPFEMIPWGSHGQGVSAQGMHPVTAADFERLSDRFAAVLFVEALHEEIANGILALEAKRFPVVVANLERDLPVSATWVDHAKSVRRAVEILVSFQHRRIGYIGDDPALLFYGKTLEAFRAGMDRAGLPVDESLVVMCDSHTVSAVLQAYQAGKQLLQRADPPTAFVTARDKFAEGLCHAIEEAGLKVGRDVSVIGFDNTSWPCHDPYVTTFQEPCHEMGAVAAEMLVNRLINGWRPPEKREIEASLILRRSAGPVPEHAVAPTSSTQ